MIIQQFMKFRLPGRVGLVALLACLGTNSGPAAASNPIITTAYTADPSAHVFNGRMYLYGSHDRNDAKVYDMNDYHVYSTDDMANWQDHGVILSVRDIPYADAKSRLWAPDANEKDGIYYDYFPILGIPGVKQPLIGVATSPSPTGPFKAEPAAIPDCYGIDPSCFVDDDGKAYLVWAGAGCQIAPLKPNMKELAAAPVQIKGAENFFEGPWIFKREQKYYLTYPAHMAGGSGHGGSGQFFDYAMADQVTGPYAYEGHFSQSGPGVGNIHGSQVKWGDTWYCFYHDASLSVGQLKRGFKRSARVDVMHFNADGTIQPLVWTAQGPPKLKDLDPYARHVAACLNQTDAPEGPHVVKMKAAAGGGVNVGFAKPGDWVKYANVALGAGAGSVEINASAPAAGGVLELRLDSLEGPVIAACEIPATGADTPRAVTFPVKNASGLHDLYMIEAGRQGASVDVDWFRFLLRLP